MISANERRLKEALEAAIAPSFLKGDVLVNVRCDCGALEPEEQRNALRAARRRHTSFAVSVNQLYNVKKEPVV